MKLVFFVATLAILSGCGSGFEGGGSDPTGGAGGSGGTDSVSIAAGASSTAGNGDGSPTCIPDALHLCPTKPGCTPDAFHTCQ